MSYLKKMLFVMVVVSVLAAGMAMAAAPFASDLLVHLDASDVIADGSGVVEQMTDLSGNGNHAVQSVAANRPTLEVELATGRNVVKFDPSDANELLTIAHSDSLLTSDPNLTVVALLGHEGTVGLTEQWITKGYYTWAGPDDGWAIYWHYSSGNRSYMGVGTGGTVNDDKAMIYRAVVASRLITLTMRIGPNKNIGETPAWEIDGWYNEYEFTNQVSFHDEFDGDHNNTNDIDIGSTGTYLAALLIYDRDLTDAEVTQVREYLEALYPTWPPVNCDAVYNFGYGLDMDFNEDCYVDFKDLAIFAQSWLDCNDPESPCNYVF